jgi:hypothetical protein
VLVISLSVLFEICLIACCTYNYNEDEEVNIL